MQRPLRHGLLQKAELDALALPYKIYQPCGDTLAYIIAMTRVGPIYIKAFASYEEAEDYLLSKLTQEGWDERWDMYPRHTEA